MTVDVYTRIQTLLDNQLNSVPSIPQFFKEDQTVQTDNAQSPWCRGIMLSAKTEQQSIGIGGTAKYQGIYQIDIYRPKGVGWNDSRFPITVVGDAVIRAFKTGTQVSDGVVALNFASASRSPAMPDLQSKYYRVSIDVEWFCVLDIGS